MNEQRTFHRERSGLRTFFTLLGIGLIITTFMLARSANKEEENLDRLQASRIQAIPNYVSNRYWEQHKICEEIDDMKSERGVYKKRYYGFLLAGVGIVILLFVARDIQNGNRNIRRCKGSSGYDPLA